MILGVGADVVQIPRIERLYIKLGKKFLEKNYHALEIEEFRKLSNSEKQISFLAKRFAGKEAFAKALGVGIGQIAFKEIAIINNKLGAPVVKIFSKMFEEDKYSIHISLADDYPVAIAYVMVYRPEK